MWLNVVIYFYMIQPRFEVAGSLAICFQGLHPMANRVGSGSRRCPPTPPGILTYHGGFH